MTHSSSPCVWASYGPTWCVQHSSRRPSDDVNICEARIRTIADEQAAREDADDLTRLIEAREDFVPDFVRHFESPFDNPMDRIQADDEILEALSRLGVDRADR